MGILNKVKFFKDRRWNKLAKITPTSIKPAEKHLIVNAP
jgi:hypothetical protein